MKCPSCEFENSENEEFCSGCGTELAPKEQADDPPAVTEQKPMTPEEVEEYKFLTLPKVPIATSSAGATHTGLVKENNEDAFIVQVVEYPLHKIAVHVAILSDGMGGEPAGEVCGELAVHETWCGIRFLLPYFEQQHGFQKLDFWRFVNRQLESYLPAQISSANNRVSRFGAAKQFKRGGFGATIVVAVTVCDLETGHVIVHGYNEGDARCAVAIGRQFTQLSKDHTIAGNPYRFLGRHDHISGTSFNWEVWMAEADFQAFWVLLYSDGLWNMLSPVEVTNLTNQLEDPQEVCSTLVEQALHVETPFGKTLGDERVTTGDDNVTITATRISVQGENA